MENSNYEKAKEEGIKDFREMNNQTEIADIDALPLIDSFLSSFAEKIKEGVEKDKRETLTVDKFEYPKESMDLINKLLSDSQTIKE